MTRRAGLAPALAQLPSRAVRRHEKLAVRAFEAAVPFGLAGHQLGPERLVAVRAHDLVRSVWCGDVRHQSTVPANAGLVPKATSSCWGLTPRGQTPDLDLCQ